jgi:hypothetical protein
VEKAKEIIEKAKEAYKKKFGWLECIKLSQLRKKLK